jgi:PucR family transcriptional regulator, purine catabolism regulatory protein
MIKSLLEVIMWLSMKDVLDTEILSPAKVRTAIHRLENIPVEWVSVMEYPVEDYIRKNEFVLSTGIGCHEDIDVFRNFVLDVLHSGASALAIALGRYIKEIPMEIIHLAEKHGFPIIELPWNIRFSDIVQAVLSRLNHWHTHTMNHYEKIQKELLHLFLSDGTLSQAADIIEQEIGTPVVIVDVHGVVKGKSKNSDSLMMKLESHVRPLSYHEVLDRSNNYAIDIDSLDVTDSILQASIRTTNQKTNGFLLFEYSKAVRSDPVITKEQQYMLEYITTAVSLWFQKEMAIKETEWRLKDDFVWSLASGEYHSWDYILSRAKSLGYNVNLPYVCVIGFAENLKSLFQKIKPNKITYEQWMPSMIRSIEEQVVLAGKWIHKEVMVTYQQERLIIFLETTLNQVQDVVNLFLDHVENRLKKRFPGLMMSWGIAEQQAGIRTFHDSFNNAKIALDIGRRQMGPGYRYTQVNTSIFRILLPLSKNPDVLGIVLSTIEQLIDYDNHRGGDLVHTLTTYIRNQGNISQTARELCVHRHTLLYRLKKIESLTGRSLMNPDDLFLLDLCIKLWMIGFDQS